MSHAVPTAPSARLYDRANYVYLRLTHDEVRGMVLESFLGSGGAAGRSPWSPLRHQSLVADYGWFNDQAETRHGTS